MCAALVTIGTPVRSRSTEILCAGSLSIVVEGADGEPPNDPEEAFDDDLDLLAGDKATCQENAEGVESARSSPRGSRRGSHTSTKEETETKIAFFKTEAAARLNELERLLDEHDQIIRELKRSESTGGLHVIVPSDIGSGPASAPIPATPTEGRPPSPPPRIATCRTAPTSPAFNKSRLSK